eukprot:TRINITY_DN7342_c0_g1_i2.p1 TRINITY_DN7342_c0_g1~~TRINITY_DN7342_c0_g1_i2.p1  ORF type:complete len:847 (+),score=104.95 TRINITY_DN7342_c0_g1_i2:473-3013(+)
MTLDGQGTASALCAQEDGVVETEKDMNAKGNGSTNSANISSREEDACRFPNVRKTYWRSASWSSSHSAPPSPGGQHGPEKGCLRSLHSKSRVAFPPLQPLSITKRSVEQWPRAGSDDIGEWLTPATPREKAAMKLDLSNIHRTTEPSEEQRGRARFSFFEKDCSRVAEHIYLGSDAVARNKEILERHCITHVLNCVGFVCPEYFKKDLVYKTLWLQDSPCEDITSILYDVFDYFEEVREQGGRVLVHCYQGVSRSTSLVIGYLMWRKGQSFEDAFQYVKAARGITNPNMGFACQLLQCQKRVHASPLSPTSLVRMFRMAPHSPYDALHLVPKLIHKPSYTALDSRGAFLLQVPSAIYVWIGSNCEESMTLAANHAANQVVRYERVEGPIVTVLEGVDNTEFWDALLSASRSSHGSGRISKQEEGEIGEDFRLGVGNKRVDSYDVDFEMYRRANVGGVVPPVPLPGNTAETRLPIKENGWGILRRKFTTGTIKELTVMNSTMDSQNDDKKALDFAEYDVQSFDPSASSPSSQSSPNSASSDSKSLSPSSSFPFTPLSGSSRSWSPSSSSRHAQSPTPSSRDGFNEHASSPVHVGLRNVSLRASPLSLAQRRGSASPSLQLPICGKGSFHASASQHKCGLDASREENATINSNTDEYTPQIDLSNLIQRGFQSDKQLETPEGGVVSEKQSNNFKKESHCMEYDYKPCMSMSIDTPNYFADTDSASPVIAKKERCKWIQPQLYRWPKLERIDRFETTDLDSRSVFFLIVPYSLGSSPFVEVYEWIGHSAAGELEGSKTYCSYRDKINETQFMRIGSVFLDQMKLQKDTPIRVVKDGEEPDEFWKHFVKR